MKLLTLITLSAGLVAAQTTYPVTPTTCPFPTMVSCAVPINIPNVPNAYFEAWVFAYSANNDYYCQTNGNPGSVWSTPVAAQVYDQKTGLTQNGFSIQMGCNATSSSSSEYPGGPPVNLLMTVQYWVELFKNRTGYHNILHIVGGQMVSTPVSGS